MKYMLNYCGGLLLVLILFSSCREEPSFDKVPHIEFRRFELTEGEDFGNKVRNLGIVIYFQDGDGNLGLATNIPADAVDTFRLKSPLYNNFFATIYVKETKPDGTSEFVLFEFPQAGFDLRGRFPRVSSGDRPEPLEGEIKYTYVFTVDTWQMLAGKVARFDIHIYDRTLPIPNKSNVITTPEFYFTP